MSLKASVFLCFFFLLASHSLSQDNRLWCTYFGAPDYEYESAIATDNEGNIYFAGTAYDTIIYGTTSIAGGFQTTFGGGLQDAVLAKFDSSGNRIWSTYYGGAEADYGMTVATDLSGNVYLAGRTHSDTAIASGGFQNNFSGGTDAFLVKFDPSGNRLWATYYGGPASEFETEVTTDKSGNVYLAGNTLSNSGIASPGCYQSFLNGPNYDAYLVKFDGSGNRIWATYFGGQGSEGFYMGVSADPEGNILMGGATQDLSGIAGGFQTIYGGGLYDGYLAKFNSSGALLWATYYGGLEEDYPSSVATDPLGNIYLAGFTESTNGIASGGFQNNYGGGLHDHFLVKFDPTGNREWGTYYGGINNEDEPPCVVTDTYGNVYLAGTSYSPAGIAFNGYQDSLIGGENAFAATFLTDGTRLCATYYGQTHHEVGKVATDTYGHVFLAGITVDSTGIASPGFQNTFEGPIDAFIVKFTSCGPLTNVVPANEFYCEVLPNPSNGILHINVGSSVPWQAMVLDLNGKILFAKEYQNNGAEIDVSHLAAGIYLLNIQKGEELIRKKIIIRH